MKNFDLPNEIEKIANWLHRNSFLDALIGWTQELKEVKKEIQYFLQFLSDPEKHKEPPSYCNSATETKFAMNILESNSTEDGTNSKELDLRRNQIRNEFDSQIPDIEDCCSSSSSDEEIEQVTTEKMSLNPYDISGFLE